MEKEHPTQSHILRPIRSFVRREGRMTPSQSDALSQYFRQFGVSLTSGPLNTSTLFGRDAPVILEIGFGMGDSLLAMAMAHPDLDYIGVEVHRPGVGSLLRGISKHQIKNLKIYQEDALEVLKQGLADQSLSGVQLFFPDPWPKARHHKRRLVQTDFARLVFQKLKPGGFFHMATDWAPYAEHMMSVLENLSEFTNRYGKNQFASDRASRIETKFERRGLKLGHDVFDLVYIRCP